VVEGIGEAAGVGGGAEGAGGASWPSPAMVPLQSILLPLLTLSSSRISVREWEPTPVAWAPRGTLQRRGVTTAGEGWGRTGNSRAQSTSCGDNARLLSHPGQD